MERTHHLSELASLVATLRAQRQAARLVVRNADRLGLIHLYFGDGHLLHVEGHTGTPATVLRDLGTWYHGAVRVDAVSAPPPAAAPPEALDAALNQALTELEARGVVRPAPPSLAPSAASAIQRAQILPDLAAMGSGAAGLPPLVSPVSDLASGAPSRGGPTGTLDAASTDQGDHLSEPQWHLLALAVRQITEQMGQLLGVQMVDGVFRQALADGARRNACLAGLEMDSSGWLRAREAGFTTQLNRYAVIEAIADLITRFETHCAELLGEQRVQQLIASAVMPMRASLEQIGLVIKTR
ncbi:MAG TPA: hypothetical protein VGN32_06860 [Ktedonobacterales bacterium]|nr:hypothetical protein [Ktedonobacterales bacterium]